MVTHDQEEGLTMADRIAVMNAGRIEQFAAPHELYARPATPFVADFVGTTNFMPATFVAPGKVAAGGRELAADTPAGLSAGDRLRICVRPEDILVRNVAESAANRIEVSVDELIFMGAFSRAKLGVAGGVALQADFSANLLRDVGVREGSRLTVALPPDRLRVFAD